MMKTLRSTTAFGLCLAATLLLAPAALAQGTLFVEGDNVGIGIDTPQFDLHLVNSASSANVWVEGAASGAMEFKDGDGPANARTAQFLSNGGTFRIRGIDDAATGQTVTGIVLDLSSGNVGVGTTNAGLRLEVENTATNGAVMRLQNGDGQCDVEPTSGNLTWSCTSDLRLKADVHPADTKALLQNLVRMDLYDYEVKASGERRLGFVAQRLQETHPDRVSAADDGILMAQQPGTTELLGAVQALHGMVTELQAKVVELEGELASERNR